MSSDNVEILEELFKAGVKDVQRHFLSTEAQRPDAILSIGKAACSMYHGVRDDFKNGVDTLIITKRGHKLLGLRQEGNVRIIESDHPIPTQKSLDAGHEALNFVKSMSKGSRLLCLISGGASSLVEVLREGVDLTELATLTNASLSNGEDIATINQKRSDKSLIKKGGLLSYFLGAYVETLAISDVQGDDIKVIGSGIGYAHKSTFNYTSKIIASNQTARMAIENEAARLGMSVAHNEEDLYGDIHKVAAHIEDVVSKGARGLYIFGGEPTVELPENPGRGGRNQALGLLLAKSFSNQENITCLVGGTDGTDGPTDAAGAIVDAHTYRSPEADIALSAADAGTYLNNSGHLLITGPTGTNVMDLAIILKR
jgi:glycerate 2-kinase